MVVRLYYAIHLVIPWYRWIIAYIVGLNTWWVPAYAENQYLLNMDIGQGTASVWAPEVTCDTMCVAILTVIFIIYIFYPLFLHFDGFSLLLKKKKKKEGSKEANRAYFRILLLYVLCQTRGAGQIQESWMDHRLRCTQSLIGGPSHKVVLLGQLNRDNQTWSWGFSFVI